ncbi:MAG: DUF58 domain-containing protein [Candidatus Marinimicrobia bacterium]|nr:DUF58 domain-containing protein [Candidatus Neomarinimicrobiota bacterium]MCH7858372.1 DUF58 domain-containing protein [Candidatus Neomarinimicrobiota bacterium]
MIPPEILEKVRFIEIRSRHLVNDIFGGEYHSVFKGRGMEFAEVREYLPGDEIRSIDWNVTARFGKPYIKRFDEERELTVILAVDRSGSAMYGTGSALKSDVGTELAAVLAFSAIKNNDKVGLIIFSDTVEKFIPPKKGKGHVLRVIRDLLYHEPVGHATRLDVVLEYLLRVLKRRSVIFLLSDFLDEGFEVPLKLAARKHDLILLRLEDPSEQNLPDLGLVKWYDPETGEEAWLNTSSPKIREQFVHRVQQQRAAFQGFCRRHNIDLIAINTHESYVKPLMNYFTTRSARH